MTFKSMDDIEREKNEEQRKKLKENITEDITDIFGGFLKKSKEEKIKRKKAQPFWKKLIKFLFIVGLLILVLNFVLGNFWLFKFFVKSLFGK